MGPDRHRMQHTASGGREREGFMIETDATVRSAGTHFGISKSTVHKDLTQRLRRVDQTLYRQVREVLNRNKEERHIRGGLATRRKYKGN